MMCGKLLLTNLALTNQPNQIKSTKDTYAATSVNIQGLPAMSVNQHVPISTKGSVNTSNTPGLGYMEIVQRMDAATFLPIIQAHTAPGTQGRIQDL